jgi:hypothetical protein
MDSMRSLDKSLPGTSPPKQQPQGSEQLLQAFKSAALTVTQLYKTATDNQSRARTEGYQDALDELLTFLDKEDIGLSDGEGWKIRRWATERLDGRDNGASNMESDDEAEKPERASSPILRRSHSATYLSARTASPIRTESAPPPSLPPPISEEEEAPMLPPAGDFTFRSSYAHPQDADMSSSDLESSDSRIFNASVISHPSHNTSSITISRPNRSASRHGSQSSRHSGRTSGTIGRGAGQKRKINLGEFFDIGNLGAKDGFSGGGKRGRFAWMWHWTYQHLVGASWTFTSMDLDYTRGDSMDSDRDSDEEFNMWRCFRQQMREGSHWPRMIDR